MLWNAAESVPGLQDGDDFTLGELWDFFVVKPKEHRGRASFWDHMLVVSEKLPPHEKAAQGKPIDWVRELAKQELGGWLDIPMSKIRSSPHPSFVLHFEGQI